MDTYPSENARKSSDELGLKVIGKTRKNGIHADLSDISTPPEIAKENITKPQEQKQENNPVQSNPKQEEVCTRLSINHPEVEEPLAAYYNPLFQEYDLPQNSLILASYNPNQNNIILIDHRNSKRQAYQCRTCHNESKLDDKINKIKHDKNLIERVNSCMPCHIKSRPKEEQIQEILNSMKTYNA